MIYLCTDGECDEIEIEADSPPDAADEYGRGGWDDNATATWWARVSVREPGGEAAWHTVTIDPTPPGCSEPEHDWQSPHAVVGGLAENPGVVGHGGGVCIVEVCRNCGAYRDTDTWAQDPATGRQGLDAVAYREADDASRAWAEGGQ